MSKEYKQPAKSPEPMADDFAAALAVEAEIASQAAEIRDGAGKLTKSLFDKLYPLLTKPIPSAFIQTVGSGTGKPYESTGIRSVQVQIDRMNNVLSPAWWWWDEGYEDNGKLAQVIVYVGNGPGDVLAHRSSRGGVDRGSTVGNLYKGSFTNAAKLAIARIGPGHEVYLGAADLDPDVNATVAKQAGGGQIGPIIRPMIERAEKLPTAWGALGMAASHVAEMDLGDCSTVAAATKALGKLTFEQAERVEVWLKRKEAEAGVDLTGPAVLDPDRVDQLLKDIEAAKPELARDGINAWDGLNYLLGSLGIDAFDFAVSQNYADHLARLTPEQADTLDRALNKIVDEAEVVEPGAEAEAVEGGGADADA